MKTIGLVGGMSWESTAEYYRLINVAVREQSTRLTSAKIIIHSVNFEDINALIKKGSWTGVSEVLGRAAHALELSGADCIGVSSCTMHYLAKKVAKHISVPLISIPEETGRVAHAAGVRTVGLVGTKTTMQQLFFKDHLKDVFNIDVLVPPLDDQEIVHRIIFRELCMGIFTDSSRAEFYRIISDLQARGAQGLIEGCTEIPLLLRPEEVSLPLLDTTRIHTDALVRFALR